MPLKLAAQKDKRPIYTSQQFIAFCALIIIYLFFFIMSVPFRSSNTLFSIFSQSYYAGFLAIGVTFTIATGGFDLSIGTGMIASALIGGYVSQRLGLPIWANMLVVLLVGVCFGSFNGFLITRMGITPFVATLGTQMIARGLGSIVTRVSPVNYPLETEAGGWFKSIFSVPRSLFPTGILLLALVAFLMAVLLRKTRFGRYILALGSNKEAARLSGIHVKKWEFLAYALCGLFVGMAGISYAAIYTTILPGEGAGFELDAIAAAVIGGTSLSGGVASIGGSMIGLFIMTVLRVGLPFIRLQPHYQTFITGFVILFAVYMDVLKNKKKLR